MSVSPPRPSSPEFTSPFYQCMKSESILAEDEPLSREEMLNAEKFLKEVEEHNRQKFVEEARRKQFAHVHRCDIRIKKGK